MKKYLAGIIILFCFISTGNIFAQNFEVEPNISIYANPEDPREGEEVTVELTSYETNLDLAYIKWTYGDKTDSGYGLKQFKVFSSKTTGAQNGVKAEITLVNGTKIEKNISFSSMSYDLAWEAVNTKYPPFYRGKKIPVKENTIRVSVLTPTSSQTSYVWLRNGKTFTNSNGNKNFIEFKNTEIEKNEKISVSIVKPNTPAYAESIEIPFTKNKTVFYEYTPIKGLMTENTIKNTVLGHENTVSILGIALGINKIPKESVSWRLSGVGVNNQQIPNLISFIKPEDSGVVKLESNFNNTRSLYQEFISYLDLNF